MQTSLFVLVALAVASVAAQTAMPQYLDQQTFETTGLRQVRNRSPFQSFEPRWAGNLVVAKFYTANSAVCTPAAVTVTLEDHATGAVLATQAATFACAATCDPVTGACALWQTVSFASPAFVAPGTRYNLRLQGVPAAWWLGVSPAAAHHGGASSLVVSPLYATKYAQFTFQTYLDAQPPADVQQGQSTLVVDSAAGSGSGSSGNTSGAASVVAPIAVVALVLVLVATALVVRRRRAAAARMQVGALPLNLAQAPVTALPMPGGHKRAVHVNVSPASNHADDESAEWWDDAGLANGQWATRTHSALVSQPVRPPRRLPALPGSVVAKAESTLDNSNSHVHPLAPAASDETLTIVRETSC